MRPDEIVAEVAKQPHLISLISAEVTEQVDRRIQEREGRLLRLLTVITAIVLFIGYAGIKELIDSAAGKAVESELEKRVAEFEVSGTIAGLQSALVAAENSRSFSNTARDGMIKAIEVLSVARKKGVKVSENPAFLPTLEKVVITMASSNNDIFADRIYDLFPDECLTVSGIVEAYLQHYGRQSVSGMGDVRSEALKRFGKFERAATTFKFPETALAHRALIDFQAQGEKREKNSRDVVALIAALDEEDRARAMKFWSDYATEGWLEGSTGESKALRAIVIAFFKAHQDDLKAIYPDIEEHIHAAANGRGDEGARDRAIERLQELLKKQGGVRG